MNRFKNHWGQAVACLALALAIGTACADKVKDEFDTPFPNVNAMGDLAGVTDGEATVRVTINTETGALKARIKGQTNTAFDGKAVFENDPAIEASGEAAIEAAAMGAIVVTIDESKLIITKKGKVKGRSTGTAAEAP